MRAAATPDSPGAEARRDLGSRVLELGLGAVLLGAPLPFGAVVPAGRLALEIGALTLLIVWALRALRHPTPLPRPLLRAGLVGLVALAAFQILPVGRGIVSAVSPRAMEVRSVSTPATEALEAEGRLLGSEPAPGAAATLSIDAGATASALRTGCALGALFLVATTVAAVRGARGLALALLIGAAFQGLYGLLVVASGHDKIWHVPKRHFLDSATGTFVNRNHFACLMAMSLACGLGLILANAARARGGASRRLVRWIGGSGSPNLLLGLLLLIGLAALLLSFSRAGIALGLAALGFTAAAAGGARRWRVRLIVAAFVATAALLPLAKIGSDRLVDRYATSADDLATPGGRLQVWQDTLEMAAAFPVFGSGYGTFSAGYPLFRSPRVRAFYSHAHNDPLQALAEGGVVGGVLLALLLVPVVRTAFASAMGRKGLIGVGLAAGLAAMLLHSLVDFNFHIPANAAVAVVLAGTLEGLPWTRPS